MNREIQALAAFCALPLLGIAADAQVVPAGLSPSDPYHLAFVTRDGRDATSLDIADYNGFVQAQAALNPALTGVGVQYRAIGSTSAIDARVNAVVGASVPVYLLDGTTKIADGFSDMWDSSIDTFLDRDQFAAVVAPVSFVWTGSFHDGTLFLPGLGGASGVITGVTNSMSSAWLFSSNNQPVTNEFPIYALSEQLTVPFAAPIPTFSPLGHALLAAALGILGSSVIRRHHPA